MNRTAAIASIALVMQGAFIPRAIAWGTSVEGPDIFGTTKVIASSGGTRESLVVQCDSKDYIAVALIYRKKEFDEIDDSAAVLLLKAAEGDPLRLEATHRTWNDNYGGIVATGRIPELRRAIEDISKATSKILVGVEVNGNQISAEFAARGSTAAMAKIIEHCRIDEISLPPA